MSNLPVVAIVGRPNVGKSRLFNRLLGKKQAIVSDTAGTTRDRIYGKIEDAKQPFLLVDTGGLEFDAQTGVIENNMQAQVRMAINEADIIMLVVDFKTQLLPQDYQVIELLRKSSGINHQLVLLVVSKCDNRQSNIDLADFYSLGLGTPFAVSAVHNYGIKNLLDEIDDKLKNQGFTKQLVNDSVIVSNIPQIALVGKPNTGKSSLVNALLEEERIVVSDIPGTTRDSTDTEIIYENKTYNLIDTAGIRRRGKIENGMEKWSIARTLQSLDRADVACLLIDAEEGITAQDQHIVNYIENAKTGLILIVNKWDTQEKGEEAREEFILKLKQKFSFLPWVSIVFISAKTRKNIFKIFPLVDAIVQERQKRITTGKLNTFVKEITRKHIPTGIKRVFPKIYYMTQVDINPPKFKLFVNKAEYFHFSYFRYLENQLREKFGFNGTNIIIDIVDKKAKE